MRSLAFAVVLVGALSGHAAAQEQLQHGKQVFAKWCAPCHATVREGERLAGTSTLAVKYQGSKPAALEERTDLTPEVVTLFVRSGVNAMPWFRKTELSDAELKDLGAYLSRTDRSAK